MKILITDDCEATRIIYKRVLEEHQVVECLDIETLHREAPTTDLIIADYETYVKFEDVLKMNRPTILASGSHVCHNHILPKPFNRAQMMSAIEKCLGEFGVNFHANVKGEVE